MKKILTSIVCAVAAVSAFAQFPGMGPSVVSPQFNEDGSITFRYRAPKAVTVQLSGDICPVQEFKTPQGTFAFPRPLDMKEGANGIWEVTVQNPTPDFHTYSFVVDGVTVLDPQNLNIARDGQRVSSKIIVPGEKSKNFLPAEHKGTLSKVWYESPAYGCERRMYVYTPYGYNPHARRSYPVLYLQHGGGGDEDAWTTLGMACEIMDNLIEQGLAEPMIVVMPNANPNQAASPDIAKPLDMPGTFGIKMDDPAFHTGGPYVKSIIEDIIPYVESHYNVIAKKSARAIAGLSMGGIYTLNVTTNYPDKFDYIGVLSMGFTPELNAVNELAPVKKAGYKLYWIGCGESDNAYPNTERLIKGLQDSNMEFVNFDKVGGHNWDSWRICLQEFAPLLFKK